MCSRYAALWVQYGIIDPSGDIAIQQSQLIVVSNLEQCFGCDIVVFANRMVHTGDIS